MYMERHNILDHLISRSDVDSESFLTSFSYRIIGNGFANIFCFKDNWKICSVTSAANKGFSVDW